MGRTNRPARLAARDSEALDSAWGTRVAPASNVPLFFRKLRRSMFSPWDRYYLLPRIIVSLRIHCCIGPGVATPSSQLNLGRSAGYELSHRGLDQLFDPSAPEISFVPGTALQHDCRSHPATDQVHNIISRRSNRPRRPFLESPLSGITSATEREITAGGFLRHSSARLDNVRPSGFTRFC